MGFEVVRMAIRNIRANKLRSALTMLGIIIGVAAVILLSAVGRGATDSVTAQIESLGSNLIQVMPGSFSVGGVSRGQGSGNVLTLADVQAIAQQDTAVRAVTPLLSTSAQVVWGPNNYQTPVQGVSANYSAVKPQPLEAGRSFTAWDVEHNATVAILGTTVVQNLFGRAADPIGQTIDIKGVPFTVIGVLAPEGTNGFINQDDRVLIPITTAQNLIDNTPYVNDILASAKSASLMNLAQAEITATLRAENHLALGQPNDFTVLNQATILSALTSITNILTTLLAGIAAISLIVGGIGIMNIMLVSVTERTREIGIRKAIGATRGAILSQFIIEAVLVSTLGGLVGMAIGVFGAIAGEVVLHLPHLLVMPAVAVAFVFALLVGVVFGVYPARRAANLNPIDALRFE
jgi:putative ABC transport system permease protein